MKIFPIFFVLIFSFSIHAASFTVNNNGDTNDANLNDGLCSDAAGNCTLRAAIQQANNLASNDTISFLPSVSATILTNGQLVITNSGSLTINGNSGKTTVSRQYVNSNTPRYRIFSINTNAIVLFSNLTISGGDWSGDLTGGHGLVNNGDLTLINCLVTNNNTTLNSGGTIINTGILTLTSTVVRGNSSLNSSGIVNSNALTLSRSTISNNNSTQANAATGILNSGKTDIIDSTIADTNDLTSTSNAVTTISNLSGATMTIKNSTISGNKTPNAIRNTGELNAINSTFSGNVGTGIINESDLNLANCTFALNGTAPINSTGTTRLINTIIGGSDGGAGYITGNYTSLGNNLIGVNPQLNPLANNGGSTRTHSLIIGSPAIDGGNNCALNATCSANIPAGAILTDQRGTGYSRGIDGDRNGTATIDIGAFEFQFAPTAATAVVTGRVGFSSTFGFNSALVTLTDSLGNSRTVRTGKSGSFRFDEVPVGETYIISVSSRWQTYAPQIISVTEDVNNLSF